MAKAKSNVKTALAKRQPAGALAPWQKEMAEEANADAAKFQQGVSRISFKGGNINVDGKDAGREIKVMIAEATFGKAYYKKGFKEGTPQVPECYAFHADEPAKMIPHDACPDKQFTQCTGCPHNRFHTAINQDGSKGDGKRCKDEVRIMCAVGEMDEESILAAEWRMATIPPGSLKNWGTYVKKLKDMGKTFRAVLTEIKCVPFKGAYKLEFTAVEDLDEAGYMAVKSKRESARDEMMQPYPALSAGEDEKPAKRKKVKGQD
jgi:hypothetical protein